MVWVVNQLLSVTETPIEAADFVASCGTIVATFDRSQDSGNVSWIVATESGEFFAKSAGTTAPVAAGRPVPYFDHAGRVRLLRNAVDVAASCDHRSLARLRNVVETGDGPVLVYDRAPGELIATPRDQRTDPASPYRRFAALPAERHVPIICELFDAHVALAAAGWIACDLYDGCLIVDFSADRLTLIDLDTYARGPFVNTMGRMFGSDRYMAPEEHHHGLDHRSADHGVHPRPPRPAPRHLHDRRPVEVRRRTRPRRSPRPGDFARSGGPLPRRRRTRQRVRLRDLTSSPQACRRTEANPFQNGGQKIGDAILWRRIGAEVEWDVRAPWEANRGRDRV